MYFADRSPHPLIPRHPAGAGYRENRDAERNRGGLSHHTTCIVITQEYAFGSVCSVDFDKTRVRKRTVRAVVMGALSGDWEGYLRNTPEHRLTDQRNIVTVQRSFSNDYAEAVEEIEFFHRLVGVLLICCSYFMQRYRKVTIWARVQFALGLKVVAVVPAVIPFSTAHRTASA